MLVIDSGEKEKIFKVLDKYNIRYKIEEIRIYHCMDEEHCGKVYTEPRKKCECGSYVDYFRCGDITNERRSFLIERKDYQNLYSSVHNNEVYTQLDKMQRAFKGNYTLLFEGSLWKLANENPDRKAQILSIPATCQQYGASFINFDNVDTTVRMLKFFDYKSGKEPKVRVKLHKSYSKFPKMVRILMNIKGVGEKTALLLWKEFRNTHTLSTTILLEPKKVLKVKNVGKKTLQLLKQWLIDD